MYQDFTPPPTHANIICILKSTTVSTQLKVNKSGQARIKVAPKYPLDVAENIYFENISHFFSKIGNNIPIIFKANNVLASCTKHSENTNVAVGCIVLYIKTLKVPTILPLAIFLLYNNVNNNSKLKPDVQNNVIITYSFEYQLNSELNINN